MKLTITKIYRNDKSKDGVPFISKKGNPYVKVSIKTQEYGDKWLSGFGGGWNMGWKEGDVIDVEVKPNGEYLNFERIDPVVALEKRMDKLEAEFKDFVLGSKEPTEVEEAPLPEEPSFDDLPF